MAANRLLVTEKEEIISDIRKLVQRPRGILKFPLNAGEISKLWHSRYSPEVLAAVELLLKEDCSVGRWSNSQVIHYQVGQRVYHINMHSGSAEEQLLDEYRRDRRAQNVITLPTDVAKAVGDDQARALSCWAQELTAFENAAQASILTLDRLLEMTTTAGQFARMVPEIVAFLPIKKQSIVQMQEKASRLPPQWSAFQREPVHAMTEHLTKCSLLPEIKSQEGCNRLGHNRYAESCVVDVTNA